MPDIPSASAAAKALEAASRFSPWRTIKRHNRLVLQEYEDLVTWARDDLQNEARDLEKAKHQLAARGLPRSGAYAHRMRVVRDEYARRWRDRKRAAERVLAEIQENEGLSAKLWRRLWRNPWPENHDAEELRTISAAWEDEDLRREAVAREVRG